MGKDSSKYDARAGNVARISEDAMSKALKTKEKLPGNDLTPQGGNAWRKLDSFTDTKSFIRHLILETKRGRIDTRKAAVLGQLACYMIKAIECSDIEGRLAQLEADRGSNDGGVLNISVSR